MQPPLRRWSHVWRFALVILISAVAWTQTAIWQWKHDQVWFWADLSIGIFCTVLVWWRRDHPVAINVVVNLLSIVSAASGGAATLAMVSLATRRRWREIVPIALLSYLAGVAQTAIMPIPSEWIFTLPFLAVIVGTTVGWGLYIGSRRELIATLRDRADRAESEQSARIAQARAAERSRIAREMHDVMAHRISLVTMHAGALAYRDDLDAAQVKQTATTIQTTSHQALTELREVLGVLRDDPGDAAPEQPQPTAGRIESLVSEVRNAGTNLDVDIDGDLDGVPTTTGRTLYRVVQESLTNARKHAPNVLVALTVDVVPDDGVTVRVTNPLPIGAHRTAPASGLGLVGLTERLELLGGRLSHGLVGPVFVLEAWLPWEPTT